MQLTFDTEEKAIEAQKQIWINYVKAKHAINKNLVGTGEIEYKSLEKLSDEEIGNLKVYGIKSGKITKTSGLTIGYVTIAKAHKIDKWYFTKPIENLMINVSNYSEEELNSDWVKLND